ncbi:hypothetical protein ACIHCQ_19680 [Streptomyces sp. NPDC052236]|uniref:hypothetical protein n=1 Tax=Streptomyces sp. NPDC052236 TaxID=3365686 RepID=UPI0037CD34E8
MKRVNMLVFGRRVAVAGVAALLVVAGGWSSWGTAQHVLLSKGREHGTLRVASCGEETCTGPYEAKSPGTARSGMIIERSVAVKKGAELSVVVKPGTDEMVRAGAAGALHAWVPLGGALVLAGLVIGGGLRLSRTAWGAGLSGAALLVAAFVAL